MSKNVSYWEKTSFLAPYDVAIVGAGIVGLSSAYFLKSQNSKLRVCIVERGLLPSGASTKNAGFACFGSVSELLALQQLHGDEAVLKMVKLRYDGLQLLRNTLSDTAITYQNTGNNEVFTAMDRLLYEQCKKAIPQLNNLLKTTVGTDIFADISQNIPNTGMKGIKGMLHNRYEGTIDSGKMMQTWWEKVSALGVPIFTNCTVNNIAMQSGQIVLQTDNAEVQAQKVLLATNAFTQQLLPDVDLKPGRGQVLVTEPIPNLKLKGAYHYERGYYYFREINGRILLGGGRNLDFEKETTTDFGHTDQVTEALERLLYEVIAPEQKPAIAMRWSGIMAFGTEPEPIITEAKPNVYVAVRCNGMGVAMGSLTGQKVAMLLNK